MRSRSSQISSAHRCAAASTSSRKRSRSATNRGCKFVAPVKITRTARRRPCRRLGMRPQFCLDRAKKAGLVVVRRRVDEDLRPARAVRHNAPHLRYDPVRNFHNDRPSLSAFSDAAALEIAGIDDPGIPRDDFEGVDVAERPIVITARCEVGDRARRVVLVASAAASGVQDADVEPARRRVPDSRQRNSQPPRDAGSRVRAARRADP